MSPTPLDRLLRPIKRFAALDISGGILLISCTVIALLWANSPWHDSYHDVWETQVGFAIAGLDMKMSLHHWINDGLMALFFLVVGLEIKRELLIGELSTFKAAALPVAAAVGGMLLPAAIFYGVNQGTEAAAGWGIPTATDIAFALGVLSLLGKRVPVSLKLFLTALAVVDDLGAVLVIAFFYTSEVKLWALGAAGGVCASMLALNRMGLRNVGIYGLLGLALWGLVMASGVHATIAGVLTAVAIPSTKYLVDSDHLPLQGRLTLSELIQGEHDHAHIGHTLHQTESPMHRVEHALLPYIDFLIMPIFALANAGLTLHGSPAEALASNVGMGVMLGLFVGKQVGVFSASWIAVKTGLAELPKGLSWGQIYGAALLAGIGFTMSLFVTGLAFSEPGTVDQAKLGILGASLLSAFAGAGVLIYQSGKVQVEVGLPENEVMVPLDELPANVPMAGAEEQAAEEQAA
ncbi:MAG: NhaA family Na+:H+ antiporter [Cognaticolwellia sp.]